MVVAPGAPGHRPPALPADRLAPSRSAPARRTVALTFDDNARGSCPSPDGPPAQQRPATFFDTGARATAETVAAAAAQGTGHPTVGAPRSVAANGCGPAPTSTARSAVGRQQQRITAWPRAGSAAVRHDDQRAQRFSRAGAGRPVERGQPDWQQPVADGGSDRSHRQERHGPPLRRPEAPDRAHARRQGLARVRAKVSSYRGNTVAPCKFDWTLAAPLRRGGRTRLRPLRCPHMKGPLDKNSCRVGLFVHLWVSRRTRRLRRGPGRARPDGPRGPRGPS